VKFFVPSYTLGFNREIEFSPGVPWYEYLPYQEGWKYLKEYTPSVKSKLSTEKLV
jgi:hypothetical protein